MESKHKNKEVFQKKQKSRKMAHQIKYLPFKYDALSWLPRIHSKLDAVVLTCNQITLAVRWEVETGDSPRCLWAIK